MLSQKLKIIHHASIHPVHFSEFSFSPTYGQISRNHVFCRCGCLPWTWLGRIVNFIGIWILNPLKTSGGQPMAFGGFGICLGGYFLSQILKNDPWILSPGIQWRPASGSPETPNYPKSQTCAVQANLPWFPDGKWKHGVSHVPRVCASGRGNTSSRTPLIIFAFGESGASVWALANSIWFRFESQWFQKPGLIEFVCLLQVAPSWCCRRSIVAAWSQK